MVPNYFRFVARTEVVNSGPTVYGDGSTLNFDENFDSSTWGVYNYSAGGFTSEYSENFDSSTWGVYNYSAGGFTSQRDDNFNLTDGWFGINEWWS